MEMRIGWLRLIGDVTRLHAKIDNLNDSLVGFCFIKNIDYITVTIAFDFEIDQTLIQDQHGYHGSW
jgi:hypothetical protein